MTLRLLLLGSLLGFVALSDGVAKDPPKKEEPKKEEPKKPETAPMPKEKEKAKEITKKAPKAGEPKKYDEVITKEAKTQPGLFAVHRIDDKVYFEVPKEMLGRLMLFRAEVAEGPAGVSYNGQQLGTKFVRFERRENKVYVYEANFDKRADKAGELGVKSSRSEPILAAFDVEAEGKDRSAVLLVTPVFMNDTIDIGVKRAAGNGSIDAGRSFLNEVKAYPKNIEARATLTFRGSGGTSSPVGPVPAARIGSGQSLTALIHYSLAVLPETPMMGRYFDPRVGYFTESFQDYANPKTWMVERQFIARFRLEKKDPKADVSEPVEPIVFYLAPEVPEKWRSYMKKGVEDWQPAFEKAGFKNAIICKDPPSRAEDPNWDPEDARHSVIRWVSEPVANAMGPHVHDPRSGEIISAHIIFWHDVLKLAQMWYFVQCSAVDERARKLPLPDEVTGDLLRYICAHEVGHTLGLRHNHRASQAFTVAQLRDPKFLAEHGPVASIMSYGRFDYVAQPEDNIPPKDLIPKVTDYDYFAIEWGYKPIPDAKTPADEVKTLDAWASRQIKEPFLRFGGEDGPSVVDPTVLTENIGSDPMEATALGLKNLDRLMGYLVTATTDPGENFDILEETYNQVLSHRLRWFSAVLKLVGGVVETRTLAGEGRGLQFTRVPEEKQREAVKFLLDNAFVTPTDLFKPAIVNQFKYSGVASDIISQQRMLLSSLLGSSRLGRLLDAEIQNPQTAYTVGEVVADVQAGVWSELKSDAPKIDPLRRDLQRAYLDILKGEFDEPSGSSNVVRVPGFGGGAVRLSELRAIARVSLRELSKQIEAALPKTKDAVTKAHLQDSLEEIRATLDAKK